MMIQRNSSTAYSGWLPAFWSSLSENFWGLMGRVSNIWGNLFAQKILAVQPLDCKVVSHLAESSHVKRFAEEKLKREPTVKRRQLVGDLYSVTGPSLIRAKLERQYRYAQEQARSEPLKPFQYLSAPAKFLNQSTVETFAGKLGDCDVGICHFIGGRKTMEDEHLAALFDLKIGDKTYPVQLFGIFDGHGGSGAARYVKEHLAEKLNQVLHECFEEVLEMRKVESLTAEEMNEVVWNALKWAFVELSCDFEKVGDSSGTTAAVMMIFNDQVFFPNIGDSRIVAKGPLTEDAKPDDPRYQKGIEKRYVEFQGVQLKAQVVGNRINGMLATGRAIGDCGVGAGVISRPKIICRPLSELAGCRVLLGCDGIFDVTQTKQAVTVLQDYADRSVEEVARNIVYSAAQAWELYKAKLRADLQARNPWSRVREDCFQTDNISAIVVQMPAINA